MYTRESLLKARVQEVKIAELAEPIYLRFLTLKDVKVVDALLKADNGEPSDDLAPTVVVKCLADGEGNRIYSDADVPLVADRFDVKLLGAITREALKMHDVATTPVEGEPLGK